MAQTSIGVLGSVPWIQEREVYQPMASMENDKLYVHAERFIQNLMGSSPEREVKVEIENWSGCYTLVTVHMLNTKTREITSIREPLNLFPSKTFLAKLELLK